MEVCVDILPSVINAVKGGARRLELCSSLCVGGLTPTIGFMKVARQIVPEDCKLFVMIRPRPYNFDYTRDEIDIMVEDIRIFKEFGADGFVFGCLNPSGEVNEEFCKILVAEALPLPCTFHRAFDVVPDPVKSLSLIEKLGFSRILTSGQKESALSGVDTIKALVDYCESMKLKVKIMPGSGIDNNNLQTILEHTGVREFHGSAKDKTQEQICITSEETVRKMVEIGMKFDCTYD